MVISGKIAYALNYDTNSIITEKKPAGAKLCQAKKFGKKSNYNLKIW